MTDKILVTGMSGLIGGALAQGLQGRAELTALNRSDVDGVSTTRADIGDLEAIRPAFEGVSTVVHLAAKAGDNYTWDELLETNVVGTRNVYQAAADAGCRRVVFASSGATVAGWERVEPYATLVSGQYDAAPESWTMIDASMATRPRGTYGATKVWGEAIGRNFADTTGLSVICVRIGYVNAEDRPKRPRDWAVWCSQRDITNALIRCIEADTAISFETIFANSDNKWGYRDLARARETVGFEPEDRAEDHR